jgi:lysophospholipid acyltransferase (LPLAT)-like uncharacterized protein
VTVTGEIENAGSPAPTPADVSTRGKRAARYPWWMEPAAIAGAAVLRLLGGTWRVTRLGTEEWEAAVAPCGHCIFALWHARLLPLVYTHRGRGVAVLISRHRDGELVARMVQKLGFETARGSSTRGGEEGLRDMIEWAERGRSLAITPDGPRGPAERVKPGLVFLASRTGFPILPVAAAAVPEWRLRSWDGFRVPRPFARVLVAYGPPIRVPPDLGREALESTRLAVEAALAELTTSLDARLARGEES